VFVFNQCRKAGQLIAIFVFAHTVLLPTSLTRTCFCTLQHPDRPAIIKD
jgi:hypothetical protein